MTTNTRSKLVMLLISFVSVLAIGCGSTQENYVFTGNVPSATTGNVRFLLDRAVLVQEGIIPNSSRSFAVEFYNTAGDVVLVTGGDLPAASSEFEVVVTGVPLSAVDYLLTIYDGPLVGGAPTGVPLLTYSDDIAIPAGNTVTADLDFAVEEAVTLSSVLVTPDAVSLTNNTSSSTRQLAVTANFSNGDFITNFPLGNTSNSLVVFTSANPLVANVTTGGLVQAVANGNTSITAVVTSYAVSQNDSASVVVTGFPSSN